MNITPDADDRGTVTAIIPAACSIWAGSPQRVRTISAISGTTRSPRLSPDLTAHVCARTFKPEVTTPDKKEITELNSKIVSTEQQLRSTSSPEDFKSLKDKVDKSISDLRESLQTRKRNKFLRDTEDYRNNQVYKWQFSTYSRYRRPVRRDYSPFSTSSESDFGSSRPAFLEQRPGRGHRGKRGGGNGHGQEQRRMATRSQLDQELHRFFRNVRLKAHFSKILPASAALPDQSSSTFTLNDLNLRLRSSFQPPHIYHPVETYIEFVKNDVKKVLESIQRGDYHIKHNLTVEEKQALSSLRDNRQIIIKPADKGGSIVVLDRDYYMGEIRTQLNDSDTYHPISHNPTLEISKEIKDLVSYYTSKGIIDTKLGEFLIKQYPVIPVFYTLPKIHKHPSKPPGRPIVASTESLLSPLAITLEKILSPLVPKIKSYLKDTTDFLISLKNVRKLPSNCLLVTMDVNSLYTSIRHSDGIESVMSFLSRHTTFSDLQLKFCKDLLTMVLTRNFFIFEDQFFIQKRGTAMGSNMAPPYANIFMDQFEITYVYPHSNFVSNIAYWRRYIDDVFLIWTGDVDSLLQFHTDLNSSVPGLTFSLLYDHNSMNFLDTRVNIDDNRNIETDLYVKSTDKNSLLKFESCHPHHIKRALPKSQHDRVNRIVSNPEVSHLRHQEMDAKFRARGYPDHVLIPTREMFRPDLPSKVPSIPAACSIWAGSPQCVRTISAISGTTRSPRLSPDLTAHVCARTFKPEVTTPDKVEMYVSPYTKGTVTLKRRCNDTTTMSYRCSVAVWSLESCHTDSSPATNDPEVPVKTSLNRRHTRRFSDVSGRASDEIKFQTICYDVRFSAGSLIAVACQTQRDRNDIAGTSRIVPS
ncbi:unnamed protein product [Ranitomeya imitator]|uniref:Reverse transcriptase domain-containing protein n=1 Tax=Ranitomeya imitator TaxID=111125 RepID=A0ABN9L7Z8_9NEOB|nr:unnamed protein product [Ranitomeya imitator]